MEEPPNGPIVYLLGNRTSHADFVRFARAKEWLVHEERPSTGPKNPYEQIWVTPDRGTALHYMDDPTPKERFLVLYGRDAGTVAIQLGAANLDIHTSEDVVDRALVASSNPERITVAWQLGVVAKLYDATILDLLKSLYSGADDSVRAAVINAIGYRGWPEARGFLEEIAANDPSADLRQNAREIVAAWWGAIPGSGDK